MYEEPLLRANSSKAQRDRVFSTTPLGGLYSSLKDFSLLKKESPYQPTLIFIFLGAEGTQTLY